MESVCAHVTACRQQPALNNLLSVSCGLQPTNHDTRVEFRCGNRLEAKRVPRIQHVNGSYGGAAHMDCIVHQTAHPSGLANRDDELPESNFRKCHYINIL